MGLLSKIFSNTKKPEGFFGKIMVNGMNGGGHAAMANWALASLQINEDGKILFVLICNQNALNISICNAEQASKQRITNPYISSRLDCKSS